LAFPGAQGWGRYAKGGRSGSVYHVTNLNDSGTGSLRDAVSKSNRIIVFDVAGVINLSSRLVFSSNLYVAGQTAPGEGVTVYGNGVSFSGSSNIICRHMRFRMGKNGDSGKDCAGIANGTNMIFDHCSFAWGLDETFSINPDGKGDLYNITLMNCLIGQGLLTHSAGGLMQADSITLYRNFYCDNGTRNNKVKGYHQYVNNVVYNWSSGCYLMGGDSSGESHANTQGNLFVNGPAGSGNACTSGNSGFHIYADDNWQDRNKDGVFNPYLIPESEYGGGPDFQSKPYNFPELEIVAAKDLVTESLPTVGASLPYRDYVDYYMVEEFMSFGTKGALISTETVLPYGVPSSWTVYQGEKRVDTDGDGMPDAWEKANGTDPNKDDAMTIAANGYANIENYINSITQETVDFYLRQPMLLSKEESTSSALSISWSDYTEGEDGFIVELKEGSEYKEMGRTTGTKMTIGSLEPATAYTIRVCAYKGDEKSDYTSATFKTQPLAVDLVEISTFSADYLWRGGDGLWDHATDSWNEGAFADGGNVLFEVEEDATVTLSETVTPGDVVVKGSGNLTLTGTGAIAGTKSVNKAGSGVLKVETANTYTGATVLHGGVFEFSKLGNGGVASGLGASQEFSQNWIWDGGTYRYTGGSVSTNRSAQLYSDSELEIADASATVKASGTFEGQGGFTLSGAGTLQPSAVDFFGYEGNTTLAGGTLYLNGVSTMWTNYNKTISTLGSSEKLVFAGGSLETKDAKEAYSTYSIPMEVQDGTYSYFKPNAWCYIKSKVTGNGTLEFVVPYLREEIQGNWDDFTGTLVANGIPTTGSESMLYLDNGTGIKNGRLYLKGAIFCLAWKTNPTTYIGGLSGDKGTYLSGSTKNTKNSVTNWIIGGADTDETFNGVIDNRCGASGYTCTVNIQKIGSGDWRLTGTNIYNGTTKIDGGRIIVNGKNNGTGAVTVNDEGTLAGFGTVAAPVTVKAGGTVYAGDTLVNSGKGLTLSSTLKVENGGIVCVPVFRTGVLNKSNKFIFKGAVTLAQGAVLELDVTEMTKTPTAGSKFTIFDLSATGASLTGEFASIVPEVPGEGLVWDTSSLYTDGILYVRKDESETAIETVNGDAARIVTTTYYDLSGKQVLYPAAPGVYVVKTRTVDGRETVTRRMF
jgi:autotransporter-associated beta strand protein